MGLIVIESAEIDRLRANPAAVSEISCLSLSVTAQKSPNAVKPCCGRAAVNLHADYDTIKRCLAGLSPVMRSKLLKFLGATKAHVILRNSRGARVIHEIRPAG